jgi:8-oxo-dGTP pyrophosphatase MutT (NUDIX family)
MVRLAVVILVDRRGHLLLQHRDEHAPRAAGQWGLVGGHVEDGEDFDTAVHRELTEETGVVAAPDQLELWREDEFEYSDGHRGHYRVYAGATGLADADIVLGEGQAIVFVDPSDIDSLELSESCAHFVTPFLGSETYRRLRDERILR